MLNPNLHEEMEKLSIQELFELKKKMDRLIEYELIGRKMLK